jgi:hypothetical protein
VVAGSEVGGRRRGGELGGKSRCEGVGEAVDAVVRYGVGIVGAGRRRFRLGRFPLALVFPIGEGELRGRGGVSLPARSRSRSRSASCHCLAFSDAEGGNVAD